MFETLEQVPEKIRHFYQIEIRSEQQFGESGDPIMQDVEVPSFDENGEPITVTVKKPVFTDVECVVEKHRGEMKTWQDVDRVIKKHRGKRDDIIAMFVAMASNRDQWEFHDKYLAWITSRPQTLEIHTENESQEPTYPQVVTWGSFKADNWETLRKAAYAPDDEQLEMMNDDMRNGTTTWLEHQDSVKNKYPRPANDKNENTH